MLVPNSDEMRNNTVIFYHLLHSLPSMFCLYKATTGAETSRNNNSKVSCRTTTRRISEGKRDVFESEIAASDSM